MISHTNSGISIHIYLDAEHPKDYRTHCMTFSEQNHCAALKVA